MRILVGKYGSRFVTRSAAVKNSASGEQGETEGLLRYLVSQGHDVAFFGRYAGEWICPVIEPAVKGFDENTTDEMQKAGFEADWEAVSHFNPEAYLMSSGYSSAMSIIGNPKGSTCQAAPIRYCAPHLNILRRSGLPRIIINNDPRTYPRDQEMSLMWAECRPCALLDQTDGEFDRVVGGRKYRVRSIYSRCESWAYHVKRENTDEYPAVIIAHAHIRDGCRQPDRDRAWQSVLIPEVAVYGKGWEHYSGEVNWQGVLKPNEVMDVLNACTACPCVAQRNFYTGKVYVCQAQGCIPLLYGDGSDPYTWDPKGLLVSLDSPWRITTPEDTRQLIREARRFKDELREWWADLCKPDWSALDNILDDIASGHDWRTLAWWQRWGGYWPC